MKKKRYSLTAKERKELNSGKEKGVKKSTAVSEDLEAPVASIVENEAIADGETVAVSSKKISRSKKINIVVAVAMVVLFLTGFVLVMLLLDECNRQNGNPLATINLDNGMQLKFHIYEEDAPFAATNFMFLSLKGFYDNTVFHDNQNNWLRFMGMENYEKHRSDDDDYCESFTGFDKYDFDWAAAQSTTRNVFSYRLKKDAGAINFSTQANSIGFLCYMYSYSSTLYQISCVDNAQTTINTTDRALFTVMGSYANQKTLDNLKEINLGNDYISMSQKNGPWYNPINVIKITSIKISNYDKVKWSNILNNFDSYMEQLGGYSSHTTSYCSIT